MSNDTTTADAKINDIFKRHHDYYKELGYTTIEEQAGDIEQVSKDYEGRAIYELLQNAFDRAKKNILIKVTEDALYIANDGQHFTYAAGYDYEKGNSDIRGDFQTLCSIHTSRKNRNESIGNKGVGFKSVFDISENDFVSIHTKGKIINDKEIIDTGFKLCNLFDNKNKTEEIKCFDDKEKINNHIETIQSKKGFENRGVPGFYFPIPLHPDNRSTNIQQIFLDERKFVTIIEIPLKQENFKKISDEVAKLEKDNFQFITLIHEKKITLFLDIPDKEQVNIEIEQDERLFFCTEISKKEGLDKLAKGGISIKNYKVAICFKRTNGKIYNFLPTQQESPLKNVDIHADFQTKIDRKSIDFKDGTIGEYNRSLLKACIELYFAILNSYIDEEQRVQLQLEYIDQTKISSELKEFDWSFFEFKTDAYDQIRSILTIHEWEYHSKSANLIAKLALKYFSHDNKNENEDYYGKFYNSIESFCNKQFWYVQQKRIDEQKSEHKKKIADSLKENEVNFLPDVLEPWRYNHIFYKKESNELEFPNFLGIKITNYEIPDETIRRWLIKDSKNTTELLKLYKQCSFDENINNETSGENLKEEEQVELIRSLFDLVKKETDEKSIHRFAHLFERKTDEVEAYFNISTIFLKTKSKKYKPAQLCKSEDVDLNFIKKSIGSDNDEKVKVFLKSLGVSYDKELTFVDSRIYEKYNDGFDLPLSIVNISKPNDIENLIIVKC